MSLVGVIKGLTDEDAKFVDTQCNWSAARHWASWWLRPSHLQMLHVDFSPMVDHVWEKCPNNTNAVERKNRDAKDGVTVPIRQANTLLLGSEYLQVFVYVAIYYTNLYP